MTDQEQDEWRKYALCRHYDPALFFPHGLEGVQEAQAVCAGCPVKQECLEFALATNQVHGVWGGTSERERVRIRRSARYTS
jgi:WhiB family redox-sensing transcriptional regulator